MNKRAAAVAAILLTCASCSSSKSSVGSSPGPTPAATSAAVPNCNGQSPVWAMPRVKVYLLPGERLYGKTKQGEYLCLSQARAEGYRSARGPVHRHHNKKLFSV
jgi:hypothetical protein